VVRRGEPLTLATAGEAIVNWLFARCHDGRFLLRVDDPGEPVGVEASDLCWGWVVDRG
jgi:hypothetical protein